MHHELVLSVGASSGESGTGEISAVLAGAPTYAMALDWDYRASVALAGLVIGCLYLPSSLSTDHNNYVQPSPAIKLHFETFYCIATSIYLPCTMGALLSIPLLAVPSMGTVRQHQHLLAGRR